MPSKLVTRVTNAPPAGSGITIKGSRLTNQEVDENFVSLYTHKLELGGGTLSGALYLHAAPSADLQAATKLYVDDHINDTVAAHAATAIANTPAGNIVATTVQAAINELDTEKAPLLSPTFTGTVTAAALDVSGELRALGTIVRFTSDGLKYLWWNGGTSSFVLSHPLASLTVNGIITGYAQSQINTDAPAITYNGPAGQLECKNTGTADSDQFAGITLHNSAQFACNFGLSGAELSVGGWSMGANVYKVHHDGPLLSASVVQRNLSGNGAVTSQQSALQVGLWSNNNADSTGAGGGPSVLFFAYDDSDPPAKQYIGRLSGYVESGSASNFYGGMTINVRANNADGSAATVAARWTSSKNLIQEGFTQLGGSGAPSIKMKKLTGTTPGAEGNGITVTHGLTSSKIIGVQVIVHQASGQGIGNAHTWYAGYEYDWYYDSTYIYVALHNTNSENILSKALTILVTYEE